MKLVSLLRLLPILVLLGASATGEEGNAPSRGDSTPTEFAALEAGVKLRLSAPREDLGGELTVLPRPDVGYIYLRGELERAAIDPAKFDVLKETYSWACDSGRLLRSTPVHMEGGLENLWQAPEESRLCRVTLYYEAQLRPRGRGDNAKSFRLSRSAASFFLTPSPKDALKAGKIDGFTIGEYLRPEQALEAFKKYHAEESVWPSRYPERYRQPEEFYKVTQDIVDSRISQNITLRLFCMDFPWRSDGFPQYVALDRNLVRKLEDLIVLLRANNIKIRTFTPIYGFRKPDYNLNAIEHDGKATLKEPYSMHQYGRAVDVIIDEDGDLVMDDLNGDHVNDVMDAAELIQYVNVLDRYYRDSGSNLVGGSGLYFEHDFHERPKQSPYVHIDTRGFLGDGGRLIRWPAAWPSGVPIVWKDMYPKEFKMPFAAPVPAPAPPVASPAPTPSHPFLGTRSPTPAASKAK